MKYRHKLLTTIVLTLALSLGIGGCGKETQVVVNPVDGENYNIRSFRQQPIMKGDTGLYYLGQSTTLEMHYYDFESGKDIFLCNRPECLHQGDTFCTATSNQYFISAVTKYDGYIYLAAYDNSKEDGMKLVLLRLAPDGSSLTEVCTLKEETSGKCGFSLGNLFIHRGVVFADYGLLVEKEARVSYGTIIYNLLDGTLSNLPEYEYTYSSDGRNKEYGRIRDRYMGSENYVYYNEPRVNPNGKTSRDTLCRYNMEDGTIEDVDGLVNNYGGLYTVTSPGTIVCTDRFGSLFKFTWGDEEAEKYPAMQMIQYPYYPGTMDLMLDSGRMVSVYASALMYYQGELYAFHGPSFYDDEVYYIGAASEQDRVFKLNDKLEAVAEFGEDCMKEINASIETPYIGTDEEVIIHGGKIAVTDDTLYWCFQDEKHLYMAEWPMEDFLAQKGGFKMICSLDLEK